MYFANAFEFAHEAVESFFASRGIQLTSLIADGPHLPLVHASADFLAPIGLGDEVTVTVDSAQCSAGSVTFAVRVVAKAERLIARVTLVHACIDKSSRHPIEIPAGLRCAISAST